MWGVEVKLHPFLVSALDGGALYPRERTPAPIEKGSGWTIRVYFGIMCDKYPWD